MDLLDAITEAQSVATVQDTQTTCAGVVVIPLDAWNAIVAARDEAQALMDKAADWQESR